MPQSMILAHNHPSGVAEPSRADELLTQSLKQALSLVEVRVLDHFIVAGDQTLSFAERGLLLKERGLRPLFLLRIQRRLRDVGYRKYGSCKERRTN